MKSKKSHQDKSRTRKRNLSKRDFLDKVFFYKYFLIFFFTYTSSKKIGSIKKLIIEKLNGWNENTLKSPSKKGDKYNTNNLLSKKLFNHLAYKIQIFFSIFCILS